MYTFWNLMILASVYYIFDHFADGTLMGSARLTVSLIIVWAFGCYFHFETSYFPLMSIGVYYLIALPAHRIINKYLKWKLSANKDN